jgi:poly [ADP-ribose] polymerase
VSLDWLLESVQNKKPLLESKFKFDKELTQQTDTAQQNGNDGTDEKPKAKKRSASDEKASGSKKKVKDSQKTTTSSLNIPIDEGFKKVGVFARKSTQSLIRWKETSK